jgi:hypothetical protein
VIKVALRNYLMTKADITGIVGDRIFPYNLHQGVAKPAIDMRVVTARAEDDITCRVMMHTCTVTLDCYSYDIDEASLLADHVIAALCPGFKGQYGNVNVRYCSLEAGPIDDDDGIDPGTDQYLYVSSVTFMIGWARQCV